MKKNLSALFVVSCLLGLSVSPLAAQKRYKHLKHARTPEGKSVVVKAHSAGADDVSAPEPETLRPITEEAFAATEPELISASSDVNLTASTAESVPEVVVNETPSVQKLRRKAQHALSQSEKAFVAMPFARDIIKSSGLEQLEPQKQQVDGKKFIIIGIILLGAALIFGIVGLALSIALTLSGVFPWTLIFNVIGLMLFFAGAALLTVGIIFRIKEKRAAK